MCFRPADVGPGNTTNKSTTNKCPSCGKTIQSMGGPVLTKCPFCKGDLIDPLAPKRPDAASGRTPGVSSPPRR